MMVEHLVIKINDAMNTDAFDMHHLRFEEARAVRKQQRWHLALGVDGSVLIGVDAPVCIHVLDTHVSLQLLHGHQQTHPGCIVRGWPVDKHQPGPTVTTFIVKMYSLVTHFFCLLSLPKKNYKKRKMEPMVIYTENTLQRERTEKERERKREGKREKERQRTYTHTRVRINTTRIYTDAPCIVCTHSMRPLA